MTHTHTRQLKEEYGRQCLSQAAYAPEDDEVTSDSDSSSGHSWDELVEGHQEELPEVRALDARIRDTMDSIRVLSELLIQLCDQRSKGSV